MTGFLNRWTGIGNAVDDPQGGEISRDKSWAFFRIACNRSYVGEDGVKADFINVMCSGAVADQVLQYLKSGRFIYVEGRLVCKNYEGEWRMEIEAEYIRMLDQPSQQGYSQQGSSQHRRNEPRQGKGFNEHYPPPSYEHYNNYSDQRQANQRQNRGNGRANPGSGQSNRYSRYSSNR